MGKHGNEEQDSVRYVVKASIESSIGRELISPNVRGFVSTIPKHITTFDEKYALRCLELIRRAAAWKFASMEDAFLPYDLSNLPRFEVQGSYDVARANGDVIMDSAVDWAASTVTYSPSMINILKSPLLRRFGSIDYDVNCAKIGLIEGADDSSPKESVADHERVVPASSFLEDSPFSATVPSLRGMLQCAWKNGLPRLVFTVDDTKEMLLAIASKVEPSDGKVADCSYTFHSRKEGKKERGLFDEELDFEVVGKMDVSSLTTSDCNNTETVETRFVLTVPSNEELRISDQNPRKHGVLAKKLANAFKSRHSFKQRRTHSKFEGQNVNFADDDSCEASEVKPDAPNLELAAIIFREVYKNTKKEADYGGWGLKFLKKLGQNASPKTILHRSNSIASNEECSSSLNVLIPAGVHGGPRTRAGGPTSLIERWASGGKCDCGGWDLGCPLTVLGSKFGGDVSSEECKSVDLFTVGSKQDCPVMKMANIHEEELYYVHFQPSLTFLQSFAIAASMIHCRSPTLRSKLYRN